MQMSVQAHLVQSPLSENRPCESQNVLLERPVRPNRSLESHARDRKESIPGKVGTPVACWLVTLMQIRCAM